MLTVRLDREYRIPTRWNEFTEEDRERFISLCSVLRDAESGVNDFGEFRCRVVFALLGIDMAKVGEISPEFEENVFRISEVVTFPYRIEEDTDGRATFRTDIVIGANLLPRIRARKGYRFGVSQGGMVDCDLTAEQYIDSVQLLQVYSSTGSREAVDRMAEVLYGEGAAKYLTDAEKTAVCYNFRGILEWVKLLPDYALIFRGSARPSAAPSSPLGLSVSIFQLAKAGYGSLDDIRRLDLFSYLGLLVQMTVDSILALKAQKVKPVDAADSLHLPVDLVTPYYSEK